MTSIVSQSNGRLLMVLATFTIALTAPASMAQITRSQDTRSSWDICPVDGFPQEIQAVERPAGVSVSEMPAEVEADFVEADLNNVRLEGSARLQQADRRMEAQSITYDRTSNEVEASGELRYDQPDFTLFGNSAFADIDTEWVEVGDAEFFYHSGHYRGSADTAEVYGTGVADLNKVTVTTCPVGNDAWEIRASDVNLDRNTGRGVARNATLRLGGVPVLYSPYVSFPIDDRRKTGFLYPRIGTAELTGFDVTVPFYWNIAPERDFTFLPRYMSKRGLMAAGEYRFLGRQYNGSLYSSFLSDDKEGGEDRWAVSYFTDIRPAPRWDSQLHYNRVSDKDYLVDFGDSLRTSSRAQLDQSARVGYRADQWRASLRYQKYQNVDKDISKKKEPYERLPEFTFSGRWPGQALGLTYHMEGSYNQFEHPKKVDGGRVSLYPTLSLPLLRSWGYLNPRASLSYAHYRLRENNKGDDNINRTLPVLSLDTGVFFDRPQQWFTGESATQTLEPRLFYLYVPNKDQDDIPTFDTSTYSTNYNLLFRENRFTGPDRIGDANQLTLALTTRFMVAGEERVGLDVGQIRFFRDREVTKSRSGNGETKRKSDIIGQARVKLKAGLNFRGSLQWDPYDNHVNVARADLRYNPEPGKQLNLFYRFNRGSLRQVDVSGFWPITRQWKVMARSLYSLEDKEMLDSVVGLEYESCCWAFRVAGRQFRTGTKDGNLKSALFMELELKGLAGIGNDLTGVLENAITGYETNR